MRLLVHTRFVHIVLGLALTVLASAFAAPQHAAAASERGLDQPWQAITDPHVDGQQIRAILAARSGELWVGTGERGLAVWNGEEWRSIRQRDGLPDDRVNTLFEDRLGRIWVATNTGVGYLAGEPLAFRKVDLAGLPALPLLAFAEDPEGGLWMGGANGLARWADDGILDNVAQFRGQLVTALWVAEDGTLWVGASEGLWQRSGNGWRPVDEIGPVRVEHLAGGGDGTLWASIDAQHLWRNRDGLWEPVDLPVPARISALLPDRGALWLGTSAGVAATSGERWVTQRVQSGGGTLITALALDTGHRLWAGTRDGLVSRLTDVRPPSVGGLTVNGLAPQGGIIELATDRIKRLEISGRDRETPGERLLVFAQLEGVDAAPRVLGLQDFGSYRLSRLVEGRNSLQVWAQDEGFNTSPRMHVTIVVPSLVHLPFGLTVRRDVAEPIARGVLVVLGVLAGATLLFLLIRGLKRAIEARAAARVREIVARGINPFGGDAPAEDLREDRGVTLAKLAQALQSGHVLLLGEWGMGKTTMLHDLQASLSRGSRSAGLTPSAYVDLEADAPERWHHVLFGRVLAALEPLMTGEQPAVLWREVPDVSYGGHEFRADLAFVMRWLAPALDAREVRLVALLDGVGAGDSARVPATVSLVHELMDAGFRIVAAAERAPAWLDSPERPFERISLSPLPDERAHDLLRRRLSGLYDWDEAALAHVVVSSGGRPGRLLACASAAVEQMLGAGRTRLLAVDFEASCGPGGQVTAS